MFINHIQELLINWWMDVQEHFHNNVEFHDI